MRRLLTAGVVMGLLLSCSSTGSFLHPDADTSFYETVAIVPFQAIASDRMAGDKMATAVMTELFVSQKFAIIDPGTFREILRTTLEPSRREARELGKEEIAKVAEAAGVQGVLEGTVRDYEMVRVGQDQFPLITLEMRLIDATNGVVVWSTSVTKKGGPTMPILGWGEVHTLGELANDVAREAVGRLPW